MPFKILAASVRVVDILRYIFESLQLTLVLNPEQACLTSLSLKMLSQKLVNLPLFSLC